MRLTDIVVRNLPAPSTGFKIYLDDQPAGFGVRVTKGGVKAFVLTYGKQRERITIGRYPVIGLADARIEARRILAERTLGKLRPKRLSFADALTLFIETRKQKNRARTARETEKLLRGYFKKLHFMNLEDIAAHHVADITDRLSKQGLQSTAAHAHTAVKTFLKWCAQRGYITSSPISELEKPALPTSRDRVLSDDEIRAIYAVAPPVIQLLFLLGQRRSETAAIRPEWLNGDTLTIPGEIAKNHRTHSIPVPSIALPLIQQVANRSPANSWSKTKAAIDAKVEIPPWRFHDARRTLATVWQRLGIRPDCIDAYLNHLGGQSAVTRTYQRHRYEAEMRSAVEVYEQWFKQRIMEINLQESNSHAKIKA